MIQERTGSLPVVRLADSGKVRTEEEFEQYLQEKAPVVKFEAKETPPDFTIEGLALTNKPVKLFYGKQFKPTDTRRLNDLGDGGKVTVWGDVFATEVKGSHHRLLRLRQPQGHGGRRRGYVQVGGPQARNDPHRPRQLYVRQVRA